MNSYMHKLICLLTFACPFTLALQAQPAAQAQPRAPLDLVRYIHPIIGTQRMGHTYPGATSPFGMVQLSPDTDTIPYEKDGKYNPDVYKYCAGYQYDDKPLSASAIRISAAPVTPTLATS